MQLKDLFKPDQYGNVPIYRDTEGFLLQKSSILDDMYEYRARDDILNGLTHYFPDTAQVRYVKKMEAFIVYAENSTFPFTFYQVRCVIATAENILLARVLEKSV